jgi:hypothetical protein
MKRIIALFLVVILTSVLAGCQRTKDSVVEQQPRDLDRAIEFNNPQSTNSNEVPDLTLTIAGTPAETFEIYVTSFMPQDMAEAFMRLVDNPYSDENLFWEETLRIYAEYGGGIFDIEEMRIQRGDFDESFGMPEEWWELNREFIDLVLMLFYIEQVTGESPFLIQARFESPTPLDEIESLMLAALTVEQAVMVMLWESDYMQPMMEPLWNLFYEIWLEDNEPFEQTYMEYIRTMPVHEDYRLHSWADDKTTVELLLYINFMNKAAGIISTPDIDPIIETSTIDYDGRRVRIPAAELFEGRTIATFRLNPVFRYQGWHSNSVTSGPFRVDRFEEENRPTSRAVEATLAEREWVAEAVKAITNINLIWDIDDIEGRYAVRNANSIHTLWHWKVDTSTNVPVMSAWCPIGFWQHDPPIEWYLGVIGYMESYWREYEDRADEFRDLVLEAFGDAAAEYDTRLLITLYQLAGAFEDGTPHFGFTVNFHSNGNQQLLLEPYTWGRITSTGLMEVRPDLEDYTLKPLTSERIIEIVSDRFR